MTAQDAARWDARYRDREVADPSPPEALNAGGEPDLVASIPSRGRALDVACGTGANAAWLARRGLHVVALDVSPTAIDLTRRTASAAGVPERVDARVHDLDAGLAPEIGSFDVIVCNRFRAVHLYESFVERLHPGGVCLVTVLSVTGADSPGPYHAPAGELIAAFDTPGVEVLRHVEADGLASIAVRVDGHHDR